MKPERLELLQGLYSRAEFDWDYNETRWLREPVDFMPRYPKGGVVVDFPSFKKIGFTLRKELIHFSDRSGFPLTPSFMIVWVEAEGIVIDAYAFDGEGAGIAEDMIGEECPMARREKKRREKEEKRKSAAK